jgi:acetyltransferase-like isoleucine patch superfamily enzyme
MFDSISRDISIAKSVIMGNNVTIGSNVIISDGVEIGHNVVIRDHVRIGNNCKIFDGAILGKKPAKASMSALTEDKDELPPLIIGDSVTIGAGCVIYCGAKISDMVFFGDFATVREDVEIGMGTIIGRGVTIENKVLIGKKCKIESNAYITAISVIEDYCFIAPCVAFSNDNFLGRTEERKKHFKGPTLRKGARIGVGAVILPGMEIGEDALVAAGSVVTSNIPPRVIVMGVPARIAREVPRDQLLEAQIFYEGQAK